MKFFLFDAKPLYFARGVFIMADARALELPLVGGGDHDWNTIFSRWNVLSCDTQIAGTVRILAWTGMALVCVWVLRRTLLDRGRQSARSIDS